MARKRSFPFFPRSRALIRKSLLPQRALLFTLLLAFSLFILFLLVSNPLPNPHSSPTNSITRLHPSSLCHPTKFRLPSAPHSKSGFPYALLRDAVIDRRPASHRILANHDPPGALRIVFYITTHLSASILRDSSTVVPFSSDIVGRVEYVLHSTKMLLRNNGHKPYKPGTTDKFGREITEWQVGLWLAPKRAGDPAVVKAMTSGADINVTLAVKPYGEDTIMWNIDNMSLACVLGWELPDNVRSRTTCGKEGNGAKGGVLFSGTALYGEKKKKRKHFKEIANFAARALLGEVKFDAIVMGVVSDYSKEDIYLNCNGQDWRCWDAMEEKNHQSLSEIASVVEEELIAIGVPREMFHRIMLVPSCRLGSDANGTERGDACVRSKRYGQYHASFFTYTILAPYYKWAASYDMDEFFGTEPGTALVSAGADEILDAADRSFGEPKGDLVFQWLNFRVQSAEDSRRLSKDVINKKRVRLVNREHIGKDEECYLRTGDDTAKSAVRCDVGLGFTIHHPVIGGEEKMEIRQGNRVYRGLRTWHARLGKLKWAHAADCDYEG